MSRFAADLRFAWGAWSRAPTAGVAVVASALLGVDGGVTFLRPVRVSSQRSYRRWRLSTEHRFGNGGDCMGLTADATGAFHPFWADSRSGTFQIYTAVVRVEEPKTRGGGAAAPRREEKP